MSDIGPHGTRRLVGPVLGVIAARYTLGKSFSVRAKATALVTSGIYSRVRNPIYISGEIFVIGIAIMLRKPYLVLLVALIIPIQILRARKEARVLEERFWGGISGVPAADGVLASPLEDY